ncbi:MAG: hypothetical protein AAGJ73_13405 [Pseudomonadota bacterium]
MALKDVNLDLLTRDELIELNHLIVERLKSLETIKAQTALEELRVGQQVRFDAGPDGMKTGILIKRNIKTASVLVDDQKWRVSPHLLEPLDQGPNDPKLGRRSSGR